MTRINILASLLKIVKGVKVKVNDPCDAYFSLPTWLRHTQITGKKLFMDVSVRVFRKRLGFELTE